MHLMVAAAFVTMSAVAVAAPLDSLAEGRRVAALAFTSPDQFLAASDPKFVTSVGGPEKLRAFLGAIAEAGPEQSLEGENVYRTKGGIMYSRVARHGGAPLTRTQLLLDSQTGRILSYSFVTIAPKPATKLAGYRSKVKLRLPFGEPPEGSAWHAIWAGPNVEGNYHASRETGFAIDIAPRRIGVADKPATAAEALCWNQPILASADGTIVKVVGDQPDYMGVAKNPGQGPGNHIIIDHGNREFTLYAHLRQGSPAVKVGDEVRTGTQLGVCGNSGSSSAPHLHFQLMNDADIDRADGLPLVFHDYFAPVRRVASGSIHRGDFVLPGFRIAAPPSPR